MRLCHKVSEERGIEPRLVPLPQSHGIGQLLAVHPDLPRQNAAGFELRLCKLCHRCFITARQVFERKAAVVVEKQNVIAPLRRGVFCQRVERVGHVL